MSKASGDPGGKVPTAELAAIKKDIRRCWRILGKLQLRLQGEIESNGSISTQYLENEMQSASGILGEALGKLPPGSSTKTNQ